jgi:hypothetical protein
MLGYLDARYRMCKPKEQTVGRFGFDLKADLWEEILVVACDGRYDRKAWDKVRRVCKRPRGFQEGILEKEGRDYEHVSAIA